MSVFRPKGRVWTELAIVGAYVALVLVATWPVARTATSRLAAYGKGDAYFSAYVLEWEYRRFTQGIAGFWDPPDFFPMGRILTYADHELGLQLFYAPARLLGAGLPLAYNVAFFGELVLSGYGAFLLARGLAGNARASFAAGALFVLLPYRILHVAHAHLQALGFSAIALFLYGETLRHARWRDAVLAPLAFLLAFLSAFYVGMYTALMIGIYVAFDLTLNRFRSPRLSGLRRLAGPSLAALGLLVAVHLPLVRTKIASGIDRRIEETLFYSARLTDYLSPSPWSRSRFVFPWENMRKGECYLGIVPMILVVAGLRRLPRETLLPFALTALALVVFSLGPHLQPFQGCDTGIPLPYGILRALVPGFTVLRTPARLASFVAIALVPIVARGAARLVDGVPRLASLLLVLLVTVHWAEAWAIPYGAPEIMRDATADRAYADLLHAPGQFAVAEIPADVDDNVEAMLGSLYHGRPIVNGYTAQFFPEFVRLFRILPDFPSIGSIAALQSHKRDGVCVRRVTWRRRPGFDAPFQRARQLGHAFPAAPLLADYGDTLVFLLRQPEELYVVKASGDLPYPWTKAPLEKLQLAMVHGRVDGGGVVGHVPGEVRWTIPMRRGQAKLAATLETFSEEASVPPLRLRIQLDTTALCDRVVPWGQRVTLTSPVVDVKLPARYTATFSVEWTEPPPARRPPISFRLSEIAIEAR